MDTQIKLRLTKNVLRPNSEQQPVGQAYCQIAVIGGPAGVEVVIDDTMQMTIAWSEVDNMDIVADTYGLIRVYQFRVVVELLGQINRLKAVFPEQVGL
jgi:hypothetical protein